MAVLRNCKQPYGIISLKHVPPEVRYPPGWVADPALSQQMEVVSVPVLETWTAMESLVHRGLVR